MRNNFFDPSLKSKSTGWSHNAICEQDIKNNYGHIKQYDFTDIAAFDIGALNPFHLREYQNLEAYPYVFEGDHDVLAWALAYLCDSPTAYALIKHIEGTGWRFALSDLDTGGFHINQTDRIIELDHFGYDAKALGQSQHFKMSLIYILSKALREIWHENHLSDDIAKYNAESALMIERARTADADSVAILIGWELRGAGHNGLWRHIIASEESDMAKVLTNLLDRYPSALYNGMAMAHIFRQWYADEARIDAQDHMTLEYFDEALEEDRLEFGSAKVDPKMFEALSMLPDGTTYLKDLGNTVTTDPFFAGLNDPVNQAHLFQIIYDNEVTMVKGIPFRDSVLARRFDLEV